MKIIKNCKNIILYIIRWQLSTPIIYLIIVILPFSYLTEIIIANFVGALLFYPIDKLLLKK